MRTDERQIAYEGPRAWVRDNRDGTWTVYRHGATHATADSTYAERTLAEARARYLDRR